MANPVTSALLFSLQHGPRPQSVLADALGEDFKDIPLSAWLATLQFQGLIRRETGGQWAITRAGLANLRGGAS